MEREGEAARDWVLLPSTGARAVGRRAIFEALGNDCIGLDSRADNAITGHSHMKRCEGGWTHRKQYLCRAHHPDLGGDIDFSLSYSTDTIHQYHSTRASYQSSLPTSASSTSSLPIKQAAPSTTGHRPGTTHDFETAPSRTASCNSIADLFHTARTSPVASLHASRRGSIALAPPSASAALAETDAVYSGLGRPASGAALARSLRQLQMTQNVSTAAAWAGREGAEREGGVEEYCSGAGNAGRPPSSDTGVGESDGQQVQDPSTRHPIRPRGPQAREVAKSCGTRRPYAQLHTGRSSIPARETSGPQASPVVSISSFDPSARATTSDQAGAAVARPSIPSASAPRKRQRPSRQTSPAMSPMQRIKSLSDFHLYLSPSRLAHIDLLSDSEPEAEDADAAPTGGTGLDGKDAREDGQWLDGQEKRVELASGRPGSRTPPLDHKGDGRSLLPNARVSRTPTCSPRRPDPLSSPAHPRPILTRAPPTRRTLHPLIFDPEETDRLHASLSIAQRRARPPLRVLGVKSAYGADSAHTGKGKDQGEGESQEGEAGVDYSRTYSGAMGLHHVEALRTYQKASSPRRFDVTGDGQRGGGEDACEDAGHSMQDEHNESSVSDTDTKADDSIQDSPTAPARDGHCHEPALPTPPMPAPDQPLRISAYSRSLNPYYGYPALLLPHSTQSSSMPMPMPMIVPRHPRRRNRDLVKTLLFLAMLRLQNVRDAVERRLGLRSLGGVPWARLRERYLDFDYTYRGGWGGDVGRGSAGCGGGGNAMQIRGEGRFRGQDASGGVEDRAGRGGVDRGAGESGAVGAHTKIGPEEGLERVELEQRRRLRSLLSHSHSPDRSVTHSGTRTAHNLHQISRGGGSTADVLLHTLGWLGWSSTYSAEWVWAIVGLVLFRGAWVRVGQRLVGVVGVLRMAWGGR